MDKLEYLRVGSQKWGKNVKGEHDRKTKNLRDRLVKLDGMNRDDDTLAEIIDVKLEPNWEMEKEELYWEQRARTNWLRDGDRNTAFSHNKISQRHRMNKIRGLKDSDGVLKTKGANMEIIIKNYFMGLFKCKGVGNTNHLFTGVKRCIDKDMN